jgi:FkbM family methyltransferase
MNARVWLGRAWRNLNRRISRLYVDSRLKSSPVALTRYGRGEGAWMAPETIPDGAVIYCGGVGVDATFDFDLKTRTGADVHSFDPTPKAIAYMERKNEAGVAFHPWGMLDEDRVVRFYMPLSETHQSSFIHDLHNTGKYVEAQCYRLATTMKKLGHDSLYLLKIDIEGSWYEVLLDMVGGAVRPTIVNVEFDSPAPVWRVRRVTSALEGAGYVPVLREKDNVTFHRADG